MNKNIEMAFFVLSYNKYQNGINFHCYTDKKQDPETSNIQYVTAKIFFCITNAKNFTMVIMYQIGDFLTNVRG
jgi:hypothetical protein